LDEQLTDKQRDYVHHLASGMESRAAAKAAGYSDSFSKVAFHRLQKKPAVVRAIAAAQATLRKHTLYTQEKAIKGIDAQIALALSAKNPAFMAAANLLTLKCKIHGLVRDKIEVEHVDMRGALIEARTRVITVLDLTPGHGPESAMRVLTAAPAPFSRAPVLND
jgi:phage terminase small subunit